MDIRLLRQDCSFAGNELGLESVEALQGTHSQT